MKKCIISLFFLIIFINSTPYDEINSIVESNGYKLTQYETTTSDLYVLKIFRLSSDKVQIDSSKRPVLLQHGLFDSSDAFLINVPSKSYSYTLVDQGYDVWLGNNRGNKYSDKNLNPLIEINPELFNDFSFVKMGTIDLPTMIDFILKTTNHTKLNYYGHSQGTSQVFTGMSLLPDYFNEKLTGVIALGPVTSLANIKPCFIKIFADLRLDDALYTLGQWNILKDSEGVLQFQQLFCKTYSQFCDGLIQLIADSNTGDDSKSAVDQYLGHFPSGASLKSAAHYAQLVRNPGTFNQYDYKLPLDNLLHYHSNTPPAIPLSNILNKVCLFVGEDDNLATIADNDILAQILTSNGSLVDYFKLPNMGHLTFFVAKDFSYNTKILECLEKFNN